MILSPTKEEVPSLSTVIQYATYLLDAWIKASFPNAQAMFFDPVQNKHENFLTKLAELKEKEAGRLFKEQMANLTLNTSDSQKRAQDKIGVCSTTQIQEFKTGYVIRSIESFDINVYPAPFNSELKIPPVASPDFCLVQKKLFKQILSNLNANKDISDLDYATLLAFFRNLFVTMGKGRYRGFSNQNPKFTYNIIKFGINLVELAQEWKNDELTLNDTQSNFVYRTIIEISYFLVYNGLWLAEDEIVKAKPENVLELLYAETYVEWAHNTYQKMLTLDAANIGEIKDLIHSIHAKYAIIALKKNEIPTLLTFADKIGFSPNVVDHIISEVLIAAALQCKETDPKKALVYLDKALINLDGFNQKPLAPNFIVKINWMRESCIQFINEIKEKLVGQLKKKIREHCPSFKVKALSTPGQLQLFLPLELAPKTISMQYPFLKIIIENSDKFTGLTIVTHDLDGDKIINALKDIEKHFARTQKKYRDNVKPSPQPPKTMSVPDDKSQIETVNKEEGKKSSGFISTPEEPYLRPTENRKEKTRHPATEAPLVVDACPAPTNKCHALDFGFNIVGNPLITPVYNTLAAQKARHPHMFLRWDGIPGADPGVEKQFEEMLNPHPDGIVTVGTYGQPGAKLWKDPTNLGENWDHCGLRLKRRGAAGFLRVVAIPESKITVEHNGTAENRYLFKLGKMKHK
jgi:hypothetical protein